MKGKEHSRKKAAFEGVMLTFSLLFWGTTILPASSEPQRQWLPTWSASPQPIWGPDILAPITIPRALRNQTLRQIAHVSLGGHQVRVRLSNRYGTGPLIIGSAHVALASAGGSIAAGTDRTLKFGGKTSISIPPGAPALSDPVNLDLPALSSLAVSTYFPDISPTTTWHSNGKQTAYLSASGDETGSPNFTAAQTLPARIFLDEIQVDSPPNGRAIVLFGDSITDGEGSSVDANHRWPDFLAERLHAKGVPIAVLNQGISGARVLTDGMGDNALARFDRDVLSQPGVDTVVIMMGINDIGWPDSLLAPVNAPAPSVDEITTGYKQLIARAHDNGLKIIGATLTPFEDTFVDTPLFGYYNEQKEAKRQAINSFIRSGTFDGVMDFDAAIRDPANPKHIRIEYDSDHLHPNDAGYRAMADAIDLSVLGIK